MYSHASGVMGGNVAVGVGETLAVAVCVGVPAVGVLVGAPIVGVGVLVAVATPPVGVTDGLADGVAVRVGVPLGAMTWSSPSTAPEGMM